METTEEINKIKDSLSITNVTNGEQQLRIKRNEKDIYEGFKNVWDEIREIHNDIKKMIGRGAWLHGGITVVGVVIVSVIQLVIFVYFMK